MEIADYLRSAGRARWLLLVLPVTAAAVAVPVAAGQPGQFVAETSVIVTPANPDAGPAVVRQTVDTYIAMTASEQVVDAVSKKVGVSADELRGGLAVPDPGSSSLVQVRYTGSDASQVEKVSEAIARTTLDLAGKTDKDLAPLQVAAFKKNYDTAVAKLAAAAKKFGPLLPPDDYRTASDRVEKLTDAIAAAEADGESTSDLEQERDSTLTALGAKRDAALAYEQLEAAVERASVQLSAAQARATNLAVRQDSVDKQDTAVLAGDAKPVDRMPFLVQVGIGAFVAGLLVAGLLLVAIETLFGRRRRARRAAQADTVATAAEPARADRADGADLPGRGAVAVATHPAEAAEAEQATRPVGSGDLAARR